MKKMKKSFMFMIVALLAAGCSSPRSTNPTAVMSEASPTAETMMQSLPTPEAMMGGATATPEVMMPSTPTSGAMMDHGTATLQAMMTQAMPNTGGMVENGTTTPEAMGIAAGSMAGTIMPEGTPTGMMMSHAWLRAQLTDVNTGKSFTLNDFRGKPVLVELMSAQCAACLQQQKSIQAFLSGTMGEVVAVSLDIAPTENASILQSHAAMNHFSWTFANVPNNLVMQIGQEFGSQYTDPANTPLLVIDSMGEVHALPLHLTSPIEIKNALSGLLPKM
jgi:hypothetical protein